MSLLRDIQDAATSDDVSVAVVLRKCMVLASRLNHEPLGSWAVRELNGYEDVADLPGYRVHPTEARGHFIGIAGMQRTNAPLPSLNVQHEHRDALFTVYVTQGVSALERMASSDEGTLHVPWPANFTAYYQDKFIEMMTLASAYKVVSVGLLVEILDIVRNKILEFALQIERENPEAGDVAPGDPRPVAETTVNHIFNTTITGGHNIVQSGVTNVIEYARQVTKGDWVSLSTALNELGVNDDEIHELRQAIDADAATDGEVPGSRTQSWIGGVMTRALRGGMAVGAEVVAQVVALAIAGYLGM